MPAKGFKSITIKKETWKELQRLRHTERGIVPFDHVIEWLLRTARVDIATQRPSGEEK